MDIKNAQTNVKRKEFQKVMMSVKILKKDGATNTLAYNKMVEPGDIIEVPETYGSILFGNTGIVQALTSIATLILAYQATQR